MIENVATAFIWEIAVGVIGIECPKFAAKVQQVGGAVYVGIYKGIGIRYTAVHMAFGRQVNHSIRIIFFKNPSKFIYFGNVGLFEHIIGLVLNIFKVFKIAGVGQGIQIDYSGFGVVLYKFPNYM